MAYAPSCLRALSVLILASILVAEEPPTRYRVELIHVDANAGFTRDELIRRAAHRTHLRAAMLSGTDFTSTVPSTAYFPTVVEKHRSGDRGELFFMDLEIGTPPKRFQAVLDTGSSIVLLTKLDLCSSTSSSFSYVPCSHPDADCAKYTRSTKGTCCVGLCMFENTYGGTHNVQGFRVNETLTFRSGTSSKDRLPMANVVVGCSVDGGNCKLVPGGASGIVGLDRGPRSLVSQLRPRLRKFSYCLNDQLNPDLKSQLLLGDLTTTGRDQMKTTDLTNEGENDYKYRVKLRAISIGGYKHDCDILMMVDSGSPYTSLPETVFEGIEKKVTSLFHKPTINRAKGLTCYLGDAEPTSMPDMTLSFDGDAIMHVPWSHYMIEVDKGFCLAMKQHPKGLYILGNYQQQNMTMTYDLDGGKLSFERTDCTQQP